MFQLTNVSRYYGNEAAVKNISMRIEAGMNFIIGPSGSGKTTLLRILGGMETTLEGDALYCGQPLKTMSAEERSNFWSNEIGFIWQDFNLLDDRTVLENVLLPQYLKQGMDEKKVFRILKELKISELAHQKAGKLSGGQKQRVAIARELMKDPQVLLADEPTSALDADAAKNIISILRSISKKRTVIVVTHDTSFIGRTDDVYELDKGELIQVPAKTQQGNTASSVKKTPGRLSLKGAAALGLTAIKRRGGQAAAMLVTIVFSALLLLVSSNGAIMKEGQEAFEQLFQTYGNTLLDISVVSSFMSAGGSGSSQEDKPFADVSQNTEGLFEKYREDSRVSYVLFAQAFDGIEITIDEKKYSVETTHTVPVMNRLTAGSMPMGDENEVVIPESFLKLAGLSKEQVIGKELFFKATVNHWTDDSYTVTPVEVKAKIVGVINTDVVTEYNGETIQYSIDDSFFFSPAALKEMRERAGMKAEPGNFYIHAKTPEAMISLKDELNAAGIVPLGRFELVEDLVRLNHQTGSQSGAANMLIRVLAILLTIIIAFFGAVLRKKEFAIYKISGYSTAQLAKTAAVEFGLITIAGAIIFFAASPLLNEVTKALWNVNILKIRSLMVGSVFTILTGVLAGTAAAAVAMTTKAMAALRTGER